MKLLIFLLLGAIINVAVAWCFAQSSPSRSTELLGYYSESLGLHIYVFREPGVCAVWAEHPSKLGDWTGRPRAIERDEFERLVPRWSVFASTDWPSLRRREGAFGWPCLTLLKRRWGASHSEGAFDLNLVISSLNAKPVPRIPIWPGFAINTIFYAAIVWGLFAMAGHIKRRRRIKRGLCVRCAYPLGTSSVCSECGTPTDNRPPIPTTENVSA